MLSTKEIKSLNKTISILKSKLEAELDKHCVSYEKVLSLSRQLDEVILNFYKKDTKKPEKLELQG